jgi:hypothetical protein
LCAKFSGSYVYQDSSRYSEIVCFHSGGKRLLLMYLPIGLCVIDFACKISGIFVYQIPAGIQELQAFTPEEEIY